MEVESNAFVRYRSGSSVFAFCCPVCGTSGELGVRDGDRNALVPCPNECGAQFIVRCGRGFFAKPTLEFAFGPARKSDDEWDAITATADGNVVWRRYHDRQVVVAGRGETPKAQTVKRNPKGGKHDTR